MAVFFFWKVFACHIVNASRCRLTLFNRTGVWSSFWPYSVCSEGCLSLTRWESRGPWWTAQGTTNFDVPECVRLGRMPRWWARQQTTRIYLAMRSVITRVTGHDNLNHDLFILSPLSPEKTVIPASGGTRQGSMVSLVLDRVSSKLRNKIKCILLVDRRWSKSIGVLCVTSWNTHFSIIERLY
jgi:hypothetical protein